MVIDQFGDQVRYLEPSTLKWMHLLPVSHQFLRKKVQVFGSLFIEALREFLCGCLPQHKANLPSQDRSRHSVRLSDATLIGNLIEAVPQGIRLLIPGQNERNIGRIFELAPWMAIEPSMQLKRRQPSHRRDCDTKPVGKSMEFTGIKGFLKTCNVQYMPVCRRNFTRRFFELPKRNHINWK